MKPVEFSTGDMEISNVMVRKVEETGKDYVVIKAYPLSRKALLFNHRNKKRANPITFVCFTEGLFPCLEIGNIYSFHGDVELGWGGTYLSITKIYGEGGKRILRKKAIKEEGNHQESIKEKL